MQQTLYTHGFVFKQNPSHIGGGYTVVDEDGTLIEREQVLKSDFTNNEAALLAISRAVELSEDGGLVMTDSMTAKDWIKRGRSQKRSDLNPLICQCREQVLRKGVRVLYSQRSQNLAGLYNKQHRPEVVE
jgi:ribonuclease HI